MQPNALTQATMCHFGKFLPLKVAPIKLKRNPESFIKSSHTHSAIRRFIQGCKDHQEAQHWCKLSWEHIIKEKSVGAMSSKLANDL